MIAFDSSVIIDYFQGADSCHTRLMQQVLDEDQAAIAPVVVTELLSQPNIPVLLQEFLAEVPLLDLSESYWQRAGKSRAKLKALRLKAKTADALIAQVCIDHDIALLTRDADFTHYAVHCGLKLALPLGTAAL